MFGLSAWLLLVDTIMPCSKYLLCVIHNRSAQHTQATTTDHTSEQRQINTTSQATTQITQLINTYIVHRKQQSLTTHQIRDRSTRTSAHTLTCLSPTTSSIAVHEPFSQQICTSRLHSTMPQKANERSGIVICICLLCIVYKNYRQRVSPSK